jgi:hypothetical protein
MLTIHTISLVESRNLLEDKRHEHVISFSMSEIFENPAELFKFLEFMQMFNKQDKIVR